MPTLSVCMIVKNEAQDLPRCLTSVSSWATEVVIVDTGSTDSTVEIARSFGARVERFAWIGDFSAARNAGIDAATGDWVLILDADEEIPADSVGSIQALLAAADTAQPSIDAYVVLCHSFLPPGEDLTFTEHPTLRLLRNRPHYRFRQAIHEQILPSIYDSGGRVQRSDVRIWHYGYARKTAQGGVTRDHRDRQILEAALGLDPANLDLLFQLGALDLRQGRPVEARQRLERVAEATDRVGPVELALTHLFLSTLALHRQDPEAALLHAEASIRASTASSSTQARLNRAQALLLLGQTATEAATQALKPGLPPEAYGQALERVREGRERFQAALEAYTQVAAAADLSDRLRAQVAQSRRLCEKLLA